MATGSIRGVLLQLICILAGIIIYLPFIRLNTEIQKINAKEKIKMLVSELQRCEADNLAPALLTRTDSLGTSARMLLEDLRASIKEDQLYLLYQPQIDDTGHCIGAEALLRWEHPLFGFIYPPLILFLAKEGAILQDLEKKIIQKATCAIQKIQTEYDGNFKVSINITAKSLLWDIESYIAENLKKYDIPASKLWIEITEQDVITNSDHVIQKLKLLKNSGHTLLIDDFGMGHTSLIYLQSNYFGVVKLDGSLVRDLETNETNRKIVSSIIDLGRELNVQVIAEYVETIALRDMLKELGCNLYQGYLYSKPIPLDDFITYINTTNSIKNRTNNT
jgi:EAL domain-containing protein (putative c-di-GMP-specific phosphodiesterase class I)